MFASPSNNPRSELATRATLVFLLLCVSGLLLVAVSFIPGLHISNFVEQLLRELGIVLFSVFTVSLLYEWLLAEVHLERFRRLLREEVERGESNAAICAQLGIERIFVTRNTFERDYPISSVMAELRSGDQARIVATSLFHFMNKAEIIRSALSHGVCIELCLLNPKCSKHNLGQVPGLVPADIISAVDAFKRDVRDWLLQKHATGTIAVRCHEIPLSASFARFSSKKHNLGVWDLSFGRDLSDKRVFVVDASRGIGQDLRKRFDRIFEDAVEIFAYRERKIQVDRLEELLTAV